MDNYSLFGTNRLNGWNDTHFLAKRVKSMENYSLYKTE